MKKYYFILIFLLLFGCISDEPQVNNVSGGSCNSACQNDQTKRSGARCKDGTTSSATGSGACSSHGGVQCWICK